MDDRDALNRSTATGIRAAMGMLKRRAGDEVAVLAAAAPLLERLARLL